MLKNKNNNVKYIITGLYAIIALLIAFICVQKYTESKIYTYNTDNIEIIDNGDGTKDYKYIETMLSPNKHYIDLAYISSSEASMEIFVDNGNTVSIILQPTVDTGTIQTTEIKPKIPTDRMKIRIHAPSDFEMIQTNVRSDSPLYSDYLLYAILLFLSIPLFSWLYIKYCESKNKITQIILMLMCILSSLFVLTRWNMIPFGADTRDHLQRIQGIMYGLIDNQMHVLIYPNMNNEYGQTAALYPSLFLYIPALLRYFSVSLMTSYNIMLVIINIATVFVMYHVSKSVFKDEKIAVAATFIHVFDGSRNMCYMSGSMLATGLAMLFIPLFIYGIYTIVVDEKPKWQYLSLGLFGVVSSHVLQTVISIAVAILIFLICFKISANKKVIISLIKAAGTFVIISLGTIVPFIKFYMMGFSQDRLVLDEFVQSQYDLEDFLVKKGHAFMVVMLVIIAFITVIYSEIKIKFTQKNQFSEKTTDNKKVTVLGQQRRDYFFKCLFVVFLICMIMLSELFPWLWLQRFGIIKTFTNMVQYPMRILGSVSVIVAFLFAYALEKVCCIEKKLSNESKNLKFTKDLCADSNNNNKEDVKSQEEIIKNKTDKNITQYTWRKYLKLSNILIVCMLVITAYSNREGIAGYIEDTPVVYDEMTGFFNSRNNEDYLPKNTKSEYYNSDSGKVSDEEKVISHFYEKQLTHINYSYETNSNKEYAIFPLFYYDGYIAKDENGELFEIRKSDENKVMVILKSTNTPKTVNLYYKVSAIYVIIDIVCAICIVLLLFNIVKDKY